VIPDIADQQIPPVIELNAVRSSELGFQGGGTIPGKTGLPCSGNGRNLAGLHVHFTHQVIGHLHEDHVTGSIETYLIGLIELCIQGRTAIAVIPGHPEAGHGAEGAIFSHLADDMIVHVAKKEFAFGPHHQTVRVVDLCLLSGASVAGIALVPGADDRFDLPLRASEGTQDEEPGKQHQDHVERSPQVAGGSIPVSVWRHAFISLRAICFDKQNERPG